ncbi:uncharacterized protein VTP21DRAFT_6797 [Calcarisporiella thermophila]|uniref:uncharacterized protein n=1 Tax=Calcarisporiella thermophila TaxID=911321 RepID=UPI00374288CD
MSDQQNLPNRFGKMNLNPSAPSFNPNARAFVPSWLSQAPAQPPAQAPPVSSAPEAPARVLKISSDPPAQDAPAKVLKIGAPSEPPAPKTEKPPEPEAAKPEPTKTNEPKSEPTKADEPKSAPPPKQPTETASAPTAAAEEDEEVDEELLKEMYGKEHVNIVFMGHVDAGKSTMGGNILVLTGMVDKRTLEKFEKEAREANRESWYLSWALDTNPEERAKGKTVEYGRAYFETDRRKYTILDAPGHKNYVPSMISGASQADVGILVISARRGEFETGFERGGQTREHTVLAKTSGVNKLIVVVNKMDDPTVNWSKERYDECVSKLTPFLKATGYNLKTDVVFMPVSGFTGANIKDRLSSEACPWYSGPSLLEYLDAMEAVDRKINAPLMMPIMEKYKDMGTIVVGKVESGKVKKGQYIYIMPNKVKCEVTTVYNELEEEINMGICGDNVRLRIKGIEEEDISVGFMLCDSRKPVHTVTRFEAQLAILDHKNIITSGYSAVLHVHACVEEVTISTLLHKLDKKTGRKSKRPPMFLKRGEKAIVVLETPLAVCVETFEDYPQLGRFTLRDEGKTIAIGKITKLLETSN